MAMSPRKKMAMGKDGDKMGGMSMPDDGSGQAARWRHGQENARRWHG
jgi:hypothetical protein